MYIFWTVYNANMPDKIWIYFKRLKEEYVFSIF